MPRNILQWVIDHPAVIVVVLAFAGQMVRGLLEARKAKGEHEATGGDAETERRTQEVQAQIRRQIAERRGQLPAASDLESERAAPPRARPETTQMPEPLGGPLGRMLEDLQRRAQPAPVVPPPVFAEQRNAGAELERQQQLADQMRSLAETRVLVQRRAASASAAQQATAEAEPAQRTAARGRLLGDLRDPQALKRAFVMREVLGVPVGLR
jgi:hypothetical protein